MNIFIRDLDLKTMQIIDDCAKQKGVSRNRYLIQLLNSYAESEIVTQMENKFANVSTFLFDAIEQNNKLLQEIKLTLSIKNGENK